MEFNVKTLGLVGVVGIAAIASYLAGFYEAKSKAACMLVSVLSEDRNNNSDKHKNEEES